MKALIQRVKRASVTIENELYSKIGAGLLVFLGVEKTDSEENADKLADKISKLRIFEDENEKMNNHAKAEAQKHTAAKTFGAVSPAVMAEVTSAALSIFMKPVR